MPARTLPKESQDRPSPSRQPQSRYQDLRALLSPLRESPEWKAILEELGRMQSRAMRERLREVPDSQADRELYFKARAIDELLSLLDTIDKQATVAERNLDLANNQ